MWRHEEFVQFMQKLDLTNLNAATLQEAERYSEEILADRDCSAWRPSPGCKVLFENVPLWYLIGNTRGRNLLEGTSGDSSPTPPPSSSLSSVKSILLLGCGDIRNVFFTVAALANPETLPGNLCPDKNHESAGYSKGKQNAAKEGRVDVSTTDSKYCHLEFHLNDLNAVVLARAILFLVLAQDLNVLLSEDLDFYWSVWCHMALSSRQLRRLQEVSRNLAERDFSRETCDIMIPKKEDAATLRTIWKAWAACKGIPSLEEVVAMRKEKVAKHAKLQDMDGAVGAMKSASVGATEKAFEIKCQYNAGIISEGSFVDSRELQDMQPIVKEEALHWHRTGMTSVANTPGTATGYVVNPTLLDPASWKWHVHYAANPFLGFMPLPAGSLRQPMRRKAGEIIEEYPLTAACKRTQREQLVSFKAYTRRGGVRFFLWGGDALKLTLYDLPLRRVSIESSANPHQKVTSTSFDIIDSSNLADHVGLLNLLACCAPLLKSPSSRLFTATILWAIAGPSLYSYLQRALGTPHLSILPTLLGLRLAFDLQFDSLNPYPSLMAGRGASNNDERPISWCLVDDQPSPPLTPEKLSPLSDTSIPSPADLSPSSQGVTSKGSTLITLIPTMLSSSQLPQAQKDVLQKYPAPCSVTAALREVAKICCKPKSWTLEGEAMARRAKCGLHNSSPLTLCLILWNLCNRLSPSSVHGLSWDALLGSSSSQVVGFALTLRAMWQHLRGLGGGLPHNGYAAGLGCKPGRQPGVVVYRRRLGLDYHIGMKLCQNGTPQLRVLLVECENTSPNKMERAQLILTALLGRVRSGSQQCKYHVIDNLQMDTTTTQLMFSLPSDHGLNKDRVLVALVAIEGIPIGGSLPLSDYEEEYVPEPVWGAASHKPFESERVCEEGKGNSRGEVEGGIELVSMVEYGGAFECVVGIQLGAEGAVSVEGMQVERRTRCCVLKLGRMKVEVMVPWPVDLTAGVSIKVMRKRGLITCTFPKASRWPFAIRNHSKILVQSLPFVRGWASEEDGPPSALISMFTLQEAVFKMKSMSSPVALSAPPFYDLRDSIHSIFLSYFRKNTVQISVMNKVQKSMEAELTILVRGVRRDHLGRMFLELVYNDHKRVQAMLASGEVEESVVMKNFVTNLNSVGDKNGKEDSLNAKVPCTPQELVLFRDLLEYNELALVASDWQRKRVTSPDWRASFIIPLESNGAENVRGESEDPSELYAMINGRKSGQIASEFLVKSEQPKKSKGNGDIEGNGREGGKKKEVATMPQTKQPPDSMSSKTGSHKSKEGAKFDIVGRGGGNEGMSVEECKGCGKRGDEAKLKRCTACFQVAYCGSVCQRADWAQHKIECKKA